MAEKRFYIVCTDKGQHASIKFSELTLRDDGTLTEVGSRQAPLAGPRTRKAVVPTEQHRQDNGTWRWKKCPRCGRDTPIREDHLRAWMDATPDGGILDLSHC